LTFIFYVQIDSAGSIETWKNVVDPDKGSPFGQPKPDPLEGLFDDAAIEDHAMQDEGKPLIAAFFGAI
jgi:hypothetical protein